MHRKRFARLPALLTAALAAGGASVAGCSPGDADDTSGSSVVASAGRFDAGTVRPGDRVGSMEVASVNLGRSPVDGGYIGSVSFEGNVRLSGSPFLLGADAPEALCFNVDDDSAHHLPRMRHDDRSVWFCFENQEAARQRLEPHLGNPVEVEISGYSTVYDYTDAHDTARLEAAREPGMDR